jgi:hypothetical protein
MRSEVSQNWKQLTPWRKIVLCKLIVAHLVRNFLLWDTKFYCGVHKSQPSDHILSHLNPVHTYLPKDISCDSSLGNSESKCCNRFLFPHAHYMYRLSHLPLFSHPNSIWWGIELMRFLDLQLSSFLCYLLCFRSKYSSSNFVLKRRQSMIFPQNESQVSQPRPSSTLSYLLF